MLTTLSVLKPFVSSAPYPYCNFWADRLKDLNFRGKKKKIKGPQQLLARIVSWLLLCYYYHLLPA